VKTNQDEQGTLGPPTLNQRAAITQGQSCPPPKPPVPHVRTAGAKREANPVGPHHISGYHTMVLMRFLKATLPSQSIEDILARVGECRSPEELSDLSSWSSYEQYRRLLQAAAVSLGDPSRLAGAGQTSAGNMNAELAETTRSFGLPAAVLTANGTGTGTETRVNPLLPIVRNEVSQVGPNEIVVRIWFVDGFEPYREFCHFMAGQYAGVAIPPAEVIEEKCQCRGDSSCTFRVRWAPIDETTSHINLLEARNRQLEALLEQIGAVICDLASDERYEDVLQGIVASTMRTVGAGGTLLVLERSAGNPQKVYAEGLSAGEVDSITANLIEGSNGGEGLIAVEVASARHRYGMLAVVEHGGMFTFQSHGIVETHARLAAAALDTASALAGVRHEAHTAQVLLRLSISLAEIVSTEEMASKLARAAPEVIGCDRAAIFLDDGDQQSAGHGEIRLAGSFGYSDDALALLATKHFNAGDFDVLTGLGVREHTKSDIGTAAAVSAPITVSGHTVGCIVAGVTSDPARLALTSHLAERLKGLAAQASISIGNARLVDEIRYQAMHDSLTALPNRALILDRTEGMLARARRSHLPVSVLFIDLDGFKEVNDSFGHAVGDQLLRAVTARLSLALRVSEGIGRLGGDEFLVLVDGSTADSGPERVAERLLEVLREPFILEDVTTCPLTLTASIGISTAVAGETSVNDLLRDADLALYRAKTNGKDCYVVFEPDTPSHSEPRFSPSRTEP
jgi:diguanylate cyclase (GGDEF)-like protein